MIYTQKNTMKFSVQTVFACLLFVFMLISSPLLHAKTIKIVALGDSLTAGYGLPPGGAFPDKLSQALSAKGYMVEMVNAGVSGDTASGGADRLDWIVGDDVDAVIVELGANDALRGLPVEVTEEALESIISRLKSRDIEVLLAGMLAPLNMGRAYGDAFNSIYPRLAEKYDVHFYPFFLDGVATNPQLNLPDGIHPNAEGIAVIVERILPFVETLIKETQ